MASESAAHPLVALGFTALEADIYSLLLEEEAPATGYRVAQALRKPASNIYKALESLESKGAVMVDEGESRLCRPIPPEELLSRLERRFRDQREEASRTLAALSTPSTDDRVYQLRSADQVFERCRSMLSRAEQVALVDAFPLPIRILRANLEVAAARGVKVAIKAYTPAAVEGAMVSVDPRGHEIFERWRGQWINVVIDGREHLIAFLGADGREVHQAIWTGSAYLSWMYHTGLSSEMIADALERGLDDGLTVEGLRDQLADYFALRVRDAPGYQELVRRFGGAPPPEKEKP